MGEEALFCAEHVTGANTRLWLHLQLLAYGVALGMRIALLFTDIETNNSGTRLGFNILFAIEISLFQLAAATVVLILQRLVCFGNGSYRIYASNDPTFFHCSRGPIMIKYRQNCTFDHVQSFP
jgi:hypothetical protein